MTTVRHVGISDDYAPKFGRQRLSLWSGAFASDYEGSAVELPKHDGYMVTIDHFLWSHKVRVACESPRTDENYQRVDDAIRAAYVEAETACQKERAVTDKLTLAFGANQYILPGMKAVWGARLIVTQQGDVDFLYDRQDAVGDPDLLKRTEEWVNRVYPQARDNIADALRRYTIDTRKNSPLWVFEDDAGIMLGNTNGSYGYFYLVGWLFDALPDGCTTKGADLLVEEITAALG